MSLVDAALLYASHLLYWSPFVVRALLDRRRPRSTQVRAVARASALLVGLHFAGVGVLYYGIAIGLFVQDGVWSRSPVQAVAGESLTLAAFVLLVWTLASFRSWRVRAAVDADHVLATEGPFAFVRHPVYASFDLLALGAFIWLPNLVTLAGLVLVHLGAELRARAEEQLLLATFGRRYAEYAARTRRFLPGLY